jgi:DNA-binding transcriptional regulator YiaG
MIPGIGGARKIRFAGRGKGKSGGYRVVTFYTGRDLPLFLLSVFGKGEKIDLTQAERNALRKELAALADIEEESVVMSAAGDKILRSVRNLRAAVQAKEPLPVHVPETVDVRGIRQRFGMSQAEFAASFGFGLDAVQNWEQGRRRPEGAARALLTVIEREPEAVRRALVP